MLPAELHHRRRAFDTGASLHRARFVVNARMNDAAIVSALMRANLGFLLKHQCPHSWKPPRGLASHRQTHHSSADHYDVISIAHRAPFPQLITRSVWRVPLAATRRVQPASISAKQGISART